jgi:predicted type IV restriction endonuclease
MDFKDQIKQLGERVSRLKVSIQTEEATKTAFVLPFLQALGYDVFNPLEVVPEYVSDIGTKKGEKVDYAILRENGDPCLLMECKHWSQNLTLHDNQLLRYFHVTKARFGILTNGVLYRFYTDLLEPNKMDEKPFLEINMLDLKDGPVEELKKFHKSYFDVDQILSSANDLKFASELKALIEKELGNPSDVLVKYFAKQVYSGQLNAKMMEYFTGLVRKSFQNTLADHTAVVLKTALRQESEASTAIPVTMESTVPMNNTAGRTLIDENNSLIVTTEEELKSFYIVQAILARMVDRRRIIYRDAQTYFAILLDDNNRKTICRMYFNSAKKFIAFFNEDKVEIKHQIDELDDIFRYAHKLEKAVLRLDPTLTVREQPKE